MASVSTLTRYRLDGDSGRALFPLSHPPPRVSTTYEMMPYLKSTYTWFTLFSKCSIHIIPTIKGNVGVDKRREKSKF